MQKIKKENGITMIALITTLSILMIIFGVTIYNTKKSLAIKDLTNLYSDVEMLEDRAKVYYAEHGEFPITNETATIEGHSVYKIDLSKINNINGLHYNNYYIDITTGRVFLNDGVEYESIRYYTKTQEEYSVEALQGPENYTIEYELNGGSLAAENPTKYTVNTKTFTLNNPTKEGYVFMGWTGTDLSEATKNVTIPKGSTGDREYTSTWKRKDPTLYPEGKTIDTVQIGDKLQIGTEEFTVIIIKDDQVIAIPKYNITLSTTNPEQSASLIYGNQAGQVKFAAEKYWENNTDVDMYEKNSDGTYKNNLQIYIDAYETKLKNTGANVSARIGTKNELLLSTSEYSTFTNNQKNALRNPGKKGYYWLGTCGSATMYLVNDAGSVTNYYITSAYGVRPVVIFYKE